MVNLTECQYTGCEGRTYRGDDICKKYGYGHYTGKISTTGCSFTTSKSQCCVLTLSSNLHNWEFKVKCKIKIKIMF